MQNADLFQDGAFENPEVVEKVMETAYFTSKGLRREQAPNDRFARIMASGGKKYTDIAGW